MSSPSIAIRNRANAAHSTGPVSPEGKARSAQNALKLGLSIQRHVILDDEDPAEFQALHSDLLRIYGPRTEREETAVQEIAHCQWAFRRFDVAEHAVLNRHPMDPFTHTSIENVASLDYMAVVPTLKDEAQPEWKPLHNLLRYRAHWERRHQRAIADFDRAQSARYREAREQRAEARHQMAEERQRMARERHQLSMARHETAKPRNAASPPASSNPNKTKSEPPSGFVPYSEPTTLQRAPIANIQPTLEASM